MESWNDESIVVYEARICIALVITYHFFNIVVGGR